MTEIFNTRKTQVSEQLPKQKREQIIYIQKQKTQFWKIKYMCVYILYLKHYSDQMNKYFRQIQKLICRQQFMLCTTL
jgi:hypothetical protein